MVLAVADRRWTNPYYFLAPMRQYFRSRRFRDFQAQYRGCRTIADIGGDHNIWDLIGRKDGVIVLNLWVPPDKGSLPYVLGDGCQLPFGDGSVDLAFSNSAIEHVGDFEHQTRFATEMLRVGKRIYCQTPCRLFPIDPHLSAFFLHWLPRRWLTPFVLRHFTLNGWLSRRAYDYDVTWLSKAQLQKIFPGCEVTTERFFGIPKAFIVTS